MKVIFWSWLNVHRFSSAVETQAWTDHRVALWKRTALASVEAQRGCSWEYVLFVHPKRARMTAGIQKEYESSTRVHIVEAGWEDGVMTGAAASKFLSSRQDMSLLTLRLDSDDRYHPKAGKAAAKASANSRWVQFNKGHAINERNGAVHEWEQVSSPFYGRRYTNKELSGSPLWHAPSHNKVRRYARPVGGRMFMVTIHARNTSTGIRHCGAQLRFNEAQRVRRVYSLPVARAVGR